MRLQMISQAIWCWTYPYNYTAPSVRTDFLSFWYKYDENEASTITATDKERQHLRKSNYPNSIHLNLSR